MLSPVKAYIVDAFIKNNSGGSPTGVVLNAASLSDEQLQNISDQLGVSHTAFVFELDESGDDILVRFFTPNGEIVNCGHATIAAHYTRANVFDLKSNSTFFQKTKEGLQRVEIIQHNDEIEIWLQQNEITFSGVADTTISYLLRALHINETELVQYPPIILASPGAYRFLVGLPSAEAVTNIIPDFDQLRQICTDNKSMGCFVYSIDKTGNEIVATARMFAPNIGVNEDVINGNSSGCLGAYLLSLSGRDTLSLSINQGQKFNRDGLVKVKAKKIEDHIETFIGGTVKIASEVTLQV